MRTRVTLKVRAGAPKTEFRGKFGDGWKLHVAAPPVDGKANQAIARFLAKEFAVPVTAVRFVAGLTASTKLVEIDGIDAEQAERAILESHGRRSHSGSSAPGKA